MKSVIASKQFAAAALMTALMALGSQSQAGDLSLPVTGDLLGTVVNSAGIPQMGAAVNLFNRYEHLIAKTMTGPGGRFAFAGLPADRYSVRVSLASFLPAARDNIAIHAGIDSMLEIRMATLFSNVRVQYAVPTAAMTEDWKWVLRSSPATRLITRYLPGGLANADTAELHSRVFSGTHAMLSISGGDTGLIDADSLQGDMGTGFILSTNVLGKNQVQVGGTYGQSANFGPAAMGLCAIYSREGSGFGEPPEIALTVSQFGLSGGAPQAAGNMQPTAAVRIMSLSSYQVFDPVDSVHIEYGATGESVDFGNQHISRASPFARATVSMGKAGEVVFAYSDGGRPEQLLAHQPGDRAGSPEAGAPVGDDLTAVANG
ncbi:MAG: carboxypeptidase-like regulatory domain-containing protein, partial [Bryobacteraceae bacterium]